MAARFAELPNAVAAVRLAGPVAAFGAYGALVALAVAAARLGRRAAPFVDEARARVRVASRRALLPRHWRWPP